MVDSQAAQEYKRLVEAALFVTSKAMSADEIAQAIGVASVGVISNAAEELQKEYETRNGAIAVFKIGDKYIMSVKEPFASRVNSLAGAPEMTKGALRILAYVSKNEPVMQSSIVKAFGTSTYDYMKELLEKEFVVRKKVGRSMRVETTSKFKEYFNF